MIKRITYELDMEEMKQLPSLIKKEQKNGFDLHEIAFQNKETYSYPKGKLVFFVMFINNPTGESLFKYEFGDKYE